MAVLGISKEVLEQAYTCIYCLQTKQQALFNSEHVIPKSFGLFGSETFTLINMVCAKCNQKFGDTIDNCLSRKTLEGLHRFQYGVKNSKKFKYSKHAKNQTRIITGGPFKGQEIELLANENITGLNCRPKGDILLKREDGSLDAYYMDQLPDRETLKQRYPDSFKEIKIVNSDKKDCISKDLSQRFNVNYELNDETHHVDCEAKSIYTKEIFRAIAKIAFNYLAFVKDTSLIIQECFNPIRNFIVEGEGEWNQFIQIENEPIIPDNDRMAVDVHLVKVGTNKREISASVSLHNKIHYKICLTTDYKKMPFKYGHYFDPHGKKINKVVESSLIQAKPGDLFKLLTHFKILQLN